MAENKELNRTYSILNLNDDCLFEIFKYLNFQDQFMLSTISPSFENVFKLYHCTYKSLKFFKIFPLYFTDFEIAFATIGHYIEDIAILKMDTRNNKFKYSISDEIFLKYFSYISKYCPNLKKLEINNLENKKFMKIISKFKNLTHLKLKDCCLSDKMMKILSKLESTIEHLTLSKYDEVTGTYMDKFCNLKTLILTECRLIESSKFNKICENAKNLEELNIINCYELDDSCIEAIIDNLFELQILGVSLGYSVEVLHKITKLKKLNSLEIDCEDDTDVFDKIKMKKISKAEILISKLVEGKKDDLKKLKLTALYYTKEIGNSIIQFENLVLLNVTDEAKYCSKSFIENIYKLTNLKSLYISYIRYTDYDYQIYDIKTSILNLLKKSPHLEVLNLEYNKGRNDCLIENIIQVLKNQNRRKRLTIILHNSYKNQVPGDIKNKTLYLENKNILNLIIPINDTYMDNYSIQHSNKTDFKKNS